MSSLKSESMRWRKSRGLTTQETVALVVFLLVLCLLGAEVVYFKRKKERRRGHMVTQNIAVNLAHNISSFQKEYGRWPVNAGEMHKSDSDLMVHLMGKDTSVNSRGINFLKDIREAKGKSSGSGLRMVGDAVEVLDHWGRHFQVFIDHDGNGNVTNPEGPWHDGSTQIYLTVAVISAGPDGVFTGLNQEGEDATRDNVRSW
jgi:hypothetical protein